VSQGASGEEVWDKLVAAAGSLTHTPGPRYTSDSHAPPPNSPGGRGGETMSASAEYNSDSSSRDTAAGSTSVSASGEDYGERGYGTTLRHNTPNRVLFSALQPQVRAWVSGDESTQSFSHTFITPAAVCSLLEA
jgi:hypothetical protein